MLCDDAGHHQSIHSGSAAGSIQCKEEDRLSSTAEETTYTGRVFQDLRIDQISALLAKEHYLIKEEELTFSVPQRVLGKGGFGVVVEASWRGTPVAIKIPRFHTSTKFLTYLANEL